MPLSALKFHFLQITFFFRRDYANTSPTNTHSVFPTHNVFKKWALHLFLKITFFLLCTPSPFPRTFPNQLFRQTNDQKWSKKPPKGGNFFFSFFIISFTFSLSPYGKKTKPLTFFPLFITGNRKTGRENVL